MLIRLISASGGSISRYRCDRDGAMSMRRRPVFRYGAVEDAKRYGNGMLVPCVLIDVWSTCFLEKSGERLTHHMSECVSARHLARWHAVRSARDYVPFRMIPLRERTRNINSANSLRQQVAVTSRIATNMYSETSQKRRAGNHASPPYLKEQGQC